jgi:hypothetical protein
MNCSLNMTDIISSQAWPFLPNHPSYIPQNSRSSSPQFVHPTYYVGNLSWWRKSVTEKFVGFIKENSGDQFICCCCNEEAVAHRKSKAAHFHSTKKKVFLASLRTPLCESSEFGQHNTTQYNTIHYNTTQHIQYNTAQHNTTQHIQHNTLQYNTTYTTQ